MTKLTNKKIKWGTDEVVKRGVDTAIVARVLKVSQRRIQQIVKYYIEHGEYLKLNMTRRPSTELNDEQKRLINLAWEETRLGARLLHIHLKEECGVRIPKNKIHEYLTATKRSVPNPNKQKKRKRCRYEREHSFSLLHTDWTQYEDLHVIAYLDDASRNILSLGEFSEATSENALIALNEAEKTAVEEYNTPILAINTDRGCQFYSAERKGRKQGITQFQQTLLDKGIKHILSRKGNPQTNGKIERWFREYKRHRHRFESSQAFKEWYNRRLHGALRLDWAENPNQAIIRKLPPASLLGLFFKNVVKED